MHIVHVQPSVMPVTETVLKLTVHKNPMRTRSQVIVIAQRQERILKKHGQLDVFNKDVRKLINMVMCKNLRRVK